MKFKTTGTSGKKVFRSGQSTAAARTDGGSEAASGVRSTSEAADTAKRAPKKRRLLRVLLAVFLLCVAAGGVGALLVMNEINGPRGDAALVTVDIPEGASTGTVAAALAEKGIVSNDLVFQVYSRLVKADGTFHFGPHELSAAMSYDEVIEVLQQETVLHVETFSMTFPEGTTCLKMAMMLEEQGVCTVDEFIAACNEDSYDVGFFDEISNAEHKFIRLEGFLFPDTYEFVVGSTAHDIVQKMLENFESRVLTDEVMAAVEASDLTLEEVIILASIVEREALGDDVYAKVSAVFHNRMNNTEVFPCLESCTSAEHLPGNFIYGVLGYYYNGDAEPYVRDIPAELIAAYDTYASPGLPVGAICNPGLVAIEATLHPEEDWPYYYFFTGPDNETFYWSMTAAEHDRQWDEAYH